MKFSQITEYLPYPIKFRATLSTLHADIISYAIEKHLTDTISKKSIIDIMNTVSYCIISGDTLPSAWSSKDPLNNIEPVEKHECKTKLGKLYINIEEVNWDIEANDNEVSDTDMEKILINENPYPETKKEDLYLKPAKYPQFDYSKPWLSVNHGGEQYIIYTSLPIIPKNQSQISVTTNVDLMTDKDLIRLFPNRFINTRAPAMYENYDNIETDSKLGVIIPINGFSPEDIKENIIRYPHFFKLKRILNGQFTSFYANIEIDGEIYDTLEVWDSLPESKIIPKNSDFIKEYVVRRYLLERDIKRIKHKYPLFGTLEPFLTLFTTPEDYHNLGYENAIDLAKKCVVSRVNYKQSRNPMIRKVMMSE